MTMAKDEADRFSARCLINDNGCWIWVGSRRPNGYGQHWLNGKNLSAHRASYLLFVGEIPAGVCVCHRCDTKVCVNPAHLFLGTYQDNTDDMINKGRYRNGRQKLTDDQVIEIIKSGATYKELAHRYGVTYGRIGQIMKAAGRQRHANCN